MIHSVIQLLARPASKEIGKIWGVDKELTKLQFTYEKIQALQNRWDSWEINNVTVESCLQELVSCCYDTEDIFDYLHNKLHSGDRELQQQRQTRQEILKSLPFKKWELPRKIIGIREKLENMIRDIESVPYSEADSSEHSHTMPSSSCCYNRSMSDGMHFVSGTCRDWDKDAVVLSLTSGNGGNGVSIIGMDGLGKSALARVIMADERIQNNFQLVLFACVSGHFKMGDVVQKLLEDQSKTEWPRCHPLPSQPSEMDLTFRDLLHGKRSLIILDDLWDVKVEDWEQFRDNYLASCQGWQILITTRNPRVSAVTKSISYNLGKMRDEDCKALIMHKADLSTSEMKNWANDIGVIAEKCKGVPIVANKLGTKLSKIGSECERRKTRIRLKETDLWETREFREIFPSLKLNVPKLQADIKRCLAYCSLFPPCHEFNKEELIQLWEVEGFVRPEHKRSSHRTGSECFDDLLSRAMLQPVCCSGKKQPLYKMHEFSHQFAKFLASKSFQRIDEGKSNLPSRRKSLRHLSLNCQNIDQPLLEKIAQFKGLRTLLLLHGDKSKRHDIPWTLALKLQRLRLLDMSNTNVDKLTPVPPFMHLRYLDLSNTNIKALLKAICFLPTLEILKLENCSHLDQLHKDLNKLISLVHLHVNMKSLAYLPSNLGLLTNLETLSSFIVRKDKGCTIVELKNLKRLREVCISSLENVRDQEEAQEALLNEKPWLRRLVLEWDSPNSVLVNAEQVFEGLQPNIDLQDLVVRNFGGQNFPSWLTYPSCRLWSIHLDSCENCHVLPSLGQLPFLKSLVIRSLRKVEVVDDQFCGQSEEVFPCLDSLEFHDMEMLVRWIGLKPNVMPCLRSLKVVGCPSLSSLPPLEHLLSLMYLEIGNCPMLQSLPNLPPTLRNEGGEVIITQCDLVKESCQIGGDDWPKIEDIPSVVIDSVKMPTRSTISPPEDTMGNEQVVVSRIHALWEKGRELLSYLKGGSWIAVSFLLLLGSFLLLSGSPNRIVSFMGFSTELLSHLQDGRWIALSLSLLLAWYLRITIRFIK